MRTFQQLNWADSNPRKKSKADQLYKLGGLCTLFLLMLSMSMTSLNGQCAYLGDQWLSSPAPTTLGVPVELTTCIFGGEYREMTNLIAGNTYRFETCGDTDFDTQITIFASGGGASLAYNDDACGSQSSVDFTPTTTGDYDVQVNQYDCAVNGICMTLTATLTAVGGAPGGEWTVATPLTCGGTVVGSTVGEPVATVDDCLGGNPEAGGVWYSFVGDGTSVTLDLCNPITNYDTRLSLYVDDCAGGITCVAANDDNFGCGNNLFASTIFDAPTEDGRAYYVLVHGFDVEVGDYALTASGGCDGTPVACPNCPGQEEVTLDLLTDAFGGDTGWTLVDLSDNSEVASVAGGTLASSTLYEESFCLDDGCYQFTITDSFGDGIPSPGEYTLTGPGGVIVTGGGDGGFQTSESTVFSVGAADCSVENDECADALPIACGDVINGSTTLATFDAAPFCGTSNTAPGIWYEFVGAGECVTITTCSAATLYDTKLSVYTGSCGTLICESGQDDDFTCVHSILHSSVTVTTELGETYYVLVHGFGGVTGNFELSATCVPVPANDLCANAIPLTHGVAALVDNTCASASPGEPTPGAGTGPSSCGSQDGWCSFETAVQNSVWYSYTPTDSDCYNIDATGGDFQLAIYEGSCGSLTELAANDDGASLEPAIVFVPLIAGNTYYIQVDGFDGVEVDDGAIIVSGGDGRPEITCPAGFEVFTDQETCLALVEQVAPEAFDDCLAFVKHRVRPVDPVTLQNAGPWLGPWTEGDLSVELLAGTYKVRWRAEDEAGNRRHCNQFVVVSEVLPCPWRQYPDGIGCEDGSAAWYDFPTETFWLSSEECHNPISDQDGDSFAFVQQELCGNGTITAKVTSLEGSNNGWAGVMMRESNDPDAKSVSIATNLGANHRKGVRSTTGGNVTYQQFPLGANKHWVRIVRLGNSFRMYTSSNGSSWFLKSSATVPMQSCIQVGLVLSSYVSSGSQIASFNNVTVDGGNDDLQEGNNALEITATNPTFSVYPSPTTGLTTVAMNGFIEQEGMLEVVNTFGQVLMSRDLGFIEETKQELDLSNLPAGVYTVRLLLATGESEMVQIVKQ